jgi:CubicO group peptidase (beta-lactamase class C family)
MAASLRRTDRRTRRRPLLAVLLVAAALAGCSSDADSSATTTTRSATTAAGATTTSAAPGTAPTDTFPGAEWVRSTPEAQGLDPAALAKVKDYAFADGRNTQGVVIVRHGVVADEWYAPGKDADSWAASWSMGKSFASALIGIAIDEGKIGGVDEKATTWYPEWKDRGLGDITLENLLQMNDGLRWDEDYVPEVGAVSDIVALVTTVGDQLDWVADRATAAAPPGTVFNYSSGTSMLFSGILQDATGESAADYGRTKLFDPLQFSKVDWWQDTEGHTLTYCCLDSTSRDYARLGLLYLHQGRWEDQQIVPASWVKASTTGAPTSKEFYGYQWWLRGEDTTLPADLFYAEGHDGQFIYVVPSLDLVVVRNGTYVKDPGPAVADPNLFVHYPSDDIIPGKGTMAPNEWDTTTFLGGIIAAIRD